MSEVIVDAAPEVFKSPEERELDKLTALLEQTLENVKTISVLRKHDMFRFLSKKARNDLMLEMRENGASIEELAKRAFTALKKNKRVRVPDEVVDALLVGNDEQAKTISKIFTSVNQEEDEDEDDDVKAA